MRSTTLSTTLTMSFLFAVGPISSVHAQIALDAPTNTYDVVANTAVSILPAPLRSFLEAHIKTVHRIVRTCDLSGAASINPDRQQQHYIMLDVGVETEDWKDRNARLSSVRRFPYDRVLAKRLFKQHGIEHGGTLPWTIMEYHKALTKAFKEGNIDEILQTTGVLLHFVSDTSWPLNTSARRVTFTQITSSQISKDGFPSTRSICDSMQPLLPASQWDQMLKRLAYEVRVSPSRYNASIKPVVAVFDTLFDTYQIRDELVLATTGARSQDRIALVFEARLEAAALLGANLIGASWEDANKPQLHVRKAQAITRGPKQSNKQPVDSLKGAYVGSKHSSVFHRHSCSHATRIKPDNIIRFTTLNKALQAGRRACKTCKPDEKPP